MNRFVRNRDLLVIILLITLICLFNFHVSQGANQPRKIQSQILNVKPKNIPVEISNMSQLNSFQLNQSNDSNSTLLFLESQTTLSPSTISKQSFFNEIITAKDYRKICSNNKSPRFNITLDEELFRSNAEIECPTGSFIVFLINSYIKNFQMREKIRQSWGSIGQLHSSKLKTLFFVYSDRVFTEKDKHDLKLEHDQYFDTVYTGIPLTTKTEVDFYLKMFQFSVFSCMKAEYFVLANDAIFINLPTLFESILTNKDIKTSPTDKKSLMLCKVKKNVIAVRNKKSAWFVTNQEWPEKHYPTFCDLTNGIIMSQQVARDLLMCSFYEKKFWINDVFVTGILPQKMSINVEAFMEDFSSNVMKNHYIFDDLSRSIFLTDGMPFNVRIWRLLFSKSMRDF